MNLVEALEAGRQDLLEAVANLNDGEAAAKPSPERWSVLECIEHVVMDPRNEGSAGEAREWSISVAMTNPSHFRLRGLNAQILAAW
jgi:hypothetical protein